MSVASCQYVILRHEGIDKPHFDLLFETSPTAALTTWRSDVWPITGATSVVKVADHRREYLEYEGPISGERGHVRRIAAGEYSPWVREASRWVVVFSDRSELEIVQVEGDRWRAAPLAER